MQKKPATALRLHGFAATVLAALAGSALLAVSAAIHVPMWPVPMTMQTLAVLLLGGSLGARAGVLAVLAYLAEGAIGLPVLAGAAPLLPVGPTAGYLVGFALAAGAVGWAADSGLTRRLPMLLAALLAGQALIWLPGVLWLHASLPLDWPATFAAGLLPFLPGDTVKLVLAAALLYAGARRTT